jgi:pimeloyl-ACP methyl ester carboxylesterase
VLDVLGRVQSLGEARAFNELLRNTIWTPEWVNENWEAMEPALSAPLSMSSRAFAEQVRACREHDAFARLGELDVPTLVTLGDRDVFIRPDLSLETAAQIPDADVRVFSGSGHVHHWEQLNVFNDLIEDWAK